MTAPRRASRARRRIPKAAWIVAALSAACGKAQSPDSIPRSPTDASAAASASTPIEPGPPFVMDDLWVLARDGDDLDLGRLAKREGPVALVRALDVQEARATAIRALAFAPGAPEIGPLAAVATNGEDADAILALDAILVLASRPRRAEEIDDLDLARGGVRVLLALAKDPKKARDRREPAIRALRMFADAGMLRPEDIPTDLDAR